MYIMLFSLVIVIEQFFLLSPPFSDLHLYVIFLSHSLHMSGPSFFASFFAWCICFIEIYFLGEIMYFLTFFSPILLLFWNVSSMMTGLYFAHFYILGIINRTK